MAGDVKVAVVSGPISSSGTGTADFTKAGFGTPKACIVLLSFDAVDDTLVAAQGRASIGFSDFTNHRCITHQDEDASAKVDCDARKSPTKTYVLLDVAAAVDIDGTVSTIADGVRLTNTTNASATAVFATVIMFGGADLQVSLDSVSLGNGVDLNTVVTTSIPQDLVFFIGTDISGEDSSSSGINNSFGVADISNDQATIVNRCMGWTSDHNNAVGSPASVIRNDRCLKVITEAAVDDWGIELTAATATSYTITTRDVSPGANMEVYALAIDVDDRGSKVGSVDSPTSGATWTPSVALGFTPQYVGLGLTHRASENIITNNATAGGHAISSNTGAGEETFHGWYNQAAAATINTNNNFRSRAIDFRTHDTSVVIQDHSHSSFNSGGWTYTINVENESLPRKWFYWAIEVAADENINVKIPQFYRGAPPPRPVAISNLTGLQFTGAVPPPHVQPVLPRIEDPAFRPRPQADFDVVGLLPTGVPPVLDERIETRFPQIVSGVGPPLPVSDYSETGRFRAVVAEARVIAVFPQIAIGTPPPFPRSAFDLRGLLHFVEPPPPSERIETRFPQIVAGVPLPFPVSGYSETGRFRAVVAEARVIAVFPQIVPPGVRPMPMAEYSLTIPIRSVVADARVRAVFPEIVPPGLRPLPLADYSLTIPVRSVVAPARVIAVFPQIVPPGVRPMPMAEYSLTIPIRSVVADARVIAVFPHLAKGIAPPLPTAAFDLTGLMHVFTPPVGTERIATRFPQIVMGAERPRPSSDYSLTIPVRSVVAPARIIAVFPEIATGIAAPFPVASFDLTGLIHSEAAVLPPALYEVFGPQFASGGAPPLPNGDYFVVGFTPRGVIVVAIEGGFFKQDFFN